MMHSANSVEKMTVLDEKNRSLSHKTRLEKIFVVFVVVLFAIIGLLLYLYLVKQPKEVGVHSRKSKTIQMNGGSEICTRQSCVLNSASKGNSY